MTDPPSQKPSGLSGAALAGLAVLTFINLFNYVDRYVAPAVFESLKSSELHLTDTQLGWLMSGFLLVYTLTAPVFGVLGDLRKRPRVLAAGVALWSVATTLAGFARTYLALFLARATVGVGEAAYGTIAPSLIADYYPTARRGRAFAVFFAAIPIGSALGYVIGGFVDHHFGWRRAFFVAGVPGLLLAAATLFLADPERGAQDQTAPHAPERPNRAALRGLLRNRPYLFTVAGYAAYTFALGGMASWMPSFFTRVRGLPGAQGTVDFGALVVVTGFVGTFLGGWAGDALLARTRQAYLWLSGIAALVAAPLTVLALASPAPRVYWTSMAVAQVLLFASTGPINSTIVNVVSPGIRASAVALSIFAIHFLGDVWSPAIVGRISDASSLGTAVLVLPAAVFVAAGFWCYEAWRGEREGFA
ncbi:MAG TPA: MFS transporter [Gemmatimonadales bacterium]|nr:MFS transporter [Gemmatimonadales bacterium]